MQVKSNSFNFLKLYLTDTIMEHIVTETNRFAKKYLTENENISENSYLGYWEDVTVPEMHVFIGLLMLMGIIHKATVEMYWSFFLYKIGQKSLFAGHSRSWNDSVLFDPEIATTEDALADGGLKFCMGNMSKQAIEMFTSCTYM